jgi:hypothetical protein
MQFLDNQGIINCPGIFWKITLQFIFTRSDALYEFEPNDEEIILATLRTYPELWMQTFNLALISKKNQAEWRKGRVVLNKLKR